MRISSARIPKRQPSLFSELDGEDRSLPVAASRNAMGDFFEELTAQVIGGERLKTDSRCDICPDLQIEEGVFAESKSIGCSRSVIVYDSRLEKDLRFASVTGSDLYYILWNHTCRVRDGMTLRELRDSAAYSVRSVTIVSLGTLALMLKSTPIVTLNTKHQTRGNGSPGYRQGYRVNLRKVQAEMIESKIPITHPMVYGRRVSAFSIYHDPSLGLSASFSLFDSSVQLFQAF